ncbi:MAG: box helicase protein [Frankiales bacterium]|jgi:DEAD/DEAH box helicase domain-containing protein|nr:box helicase protein [Frankiales bacterium]MDX6243167.1 box helicase protein [Frankiales bacterium]
MTGALGSRAEHVTHVEQVPARAARTTDWPAWVSPLVVDRLRLAGVAAPWTHQAQAASLAWSGRSTVVATGTASGKSLAYLLPALTTLVSSGDGLRPSTALYLSPTKALAMDQLRAIRALQLTQVRAATYDGDTPREERDWVRGHANLILTNPDMLHHAMLPGHARWSQFLRGLRYVVIDECHGYRGVFGSHVAQVLRRLRRLCAKYGADPVFVLASATVSEPAVSAQRLTGVPMTAVTDDGSPRGSLAFALVEPPLQDRFAGENGAPVRRSATAETADLLTDLVIAGVRTIAFVRSRRGAEAIAASAKRSLAEVDDSLVRRVAAYRGGYLPEERRALEAALQTGRLLGVAATQALELGVDIAGLDAVLITGFPGTIASMWQQAGRAGRAGQGALAVLVARDDPLDTYLVHHPAALFGRPVEATVLDPANPYVLGPHLCAAAAELPLTDEDEAVFGPAMHDVLADLVERGLLRRRPTGWYWTRRERATALADLRGTGGAPVRVVEEQTGRLLGTVDNAMSHNTVHSGAVYVHQGESYLVSELDLDDCVALAGRAEPDYSTSARDTTDITIVETLLSQPGAGASLHFGTVDVSNQVVGYLKKRLGSGEVLGEVPLDLPVRELRTRAVWWTVEAGVIEQAQLGWTDIPGAAHAAEHASIGLLPLFATCDRWDIGGVSTALHPDTGLATIFVYDGHPGGAGFAEQGFRRGHAWLQATLDVIGSCACESGCPSCVQSPKCGNGNEPLDKAGACALLRAVLAALPIDLSAVAPATPTAPAGVTAARRG